jgi:hypothetical protein
MSHLNLVQSDFEQHEKITLPRFPFCYLTFKCSKDTEHVFEVKDISYSGMQLGLRNGEHGLKEDETIHGFLHWSGRELEINGSIKWKTNMRLGVEFSSQATARQEVNSFLDLEKIAAQLKPVHRVDYGVDLPAKLKYWLRADGPIEVFVWQHADGELAKIQILIMENFVEWEDGVGLKTARVMSKRDVDTPLISEDEFVFKIDEGLDDSKIDNAKKLISHIDGDLMTQQAVDFLRIKFGA